MGKYIQAADISAISGVDVGRQRGDPIIWILCIIFAVMVVICITAFVYISIKKKNHQAKYGAYLMIPVLLYICALGWQQYKYPTYEIILNPEQITQVELSQLEQAGMKKNKESSAPNSYIVNISDWPNQIRIAP